MRLAGVATGGRDGSGEGSLPMGKGRRHRGYPRDLAIGACGSRRVPDDGRLASSGARVPVWSRPLDRNLVRTHRAERQNSTRRADPAVSGLIPQPRGCQHAIHPPAHAQSRCHSHAHNPPQAPLPHTSQHSLTRPVPHRLNNQPRIPTLAAPHTPARVTQATHPPTPPALVRSPTATTRGQRLPPSLTLHRRNGKPAPSGHSASRLATRPQGSPFTTRPVTDPPPPNLIPGWSHSDPPRPASCPPPWPVLSTRCPQCLAASCAQRAGQLPFPPLPSA